MSRTIRAGGAVLALALAGVSPAMAQIEGMPLFTNPRIATGIRVHADYGKQTGSTGGVDTHVIQGGVGFVLGPVGFDASVGTTKTTISNGCVSSPTISCAGSHVTGSLLAAIKVYGGGQRQVSVALFGGGSVDFDTADVHSGSGGAPQNKMVHIPLGAALGYRVPLGGLASLNLWGAPRWNMYQFVNCTGSCPTAPKGSFGWAVGADLPIFRILSVRAAYDSHKINLAGGGSVTVNVIGVGASLGLGGMR